MPRVCGNCKYVTDDLFANDCPLCLRPLALSSRVGSLGDTTPRAKKRSTTRLILVVGGLIFVGVAATGLATVFLAPTVFLEPAGEADSLGAVRIGMPVREWCAALGIELPPRAFSGFITWGRDGRILRVRFTDGKAVAIEEGRLPFAVTVTKVQPEIPGRRR
jgi:hypothetical protein